MPTASAGEGKNSCPQNIKLSKRLEAIAELIPTGKILADIGTDHGLLPASLIQRGKIPAAIASDINEEPLNTARAAALSAGVSGKIRFIKCDGLSGFAPGAAETIIIAGMGGETIAKIIGDSIRYFTESTSLILQPMSKAGELRKFLAESGFVALNESLVKDSGKIYPIISAKTGRERELSAAELLLGKRELISEDELFAEFLVEKIFRLERALLGMKGSGNRKNFYEINKLYEELLIIRERIKNNANRKRDQRVPE